jgi:hypothetical protein
MRFVKKDLANIPPSLISADALRDIEQIANKNPFVEISSAIYKGEYKDSGGRLQSKVRDYLNVAYKGKCAYCEQYCKAEIEHYRPKKAVTEDRGHAGYYWLCYSWSNLLPSCRYCNTEGGKGNQFPILDNNKRVRNPEFVGSKLDNSKCDANKSPLLNEGPYLLNPEIDSEFLDYFGFNIAADKLGVEINGIDAEERGKKTIKICNLNRPDLKLKRLEVYYQMKKKIEIIFELNASAYLANENVGEALGFVFKEIEDEAKDDSLSHTLLRGFVMSDVNNFETHFCPYLDSAGQREIAIQAFRNYKAG